MENKIHQGGILLILGIPLQESIFFLKSIEYDSAHRIDIFWVIFPPSQKYNTDKIPMPFVNGQYFTFTTEDD